MMTPRSSLTRRVTAALDASPSRIPVLVAGCGSGRTTLLNQVRERLGRLSASDNRFVLTSRYTARTVRLLRDHSVRFEVIQMPALTDGDTLDILGVPDGSGDPRDLEYLARAVQMLGDGRPSYVRAI